LGYNSQEVVHSLRQTLNLKTALMGGLRDLLHLVRGFPDQAEFRSVHNSISALRISQTCSAGRQRGIIERLIKERPQLEDERTGFAEKDLTLGR
jgi:hypothetical protein